MVISYILYRCVCACVRACMCVCVCVSVRSFETYFHSSPQSTHTTYCPQRRTVNDSEAYKFLFSNTWSLVRTTENQTHLLLKIVSGKTTFHQRRPCFYTQGGCERERERDWESTYAPQCLSHLHQRLADHWRKKEEKNPMITCSRTHEPTEGCKAVAWLINPDSVEYNLAIFRSNSLCPN